MQKSRRLRAALSLALFATLATGGGAYAALTSVPNNAEDALAETTASVPLSKSGGSYTTVTSLSLPAGSWVLSSEATLVSWSPSDYARCRITANGNQIASGTTMIGEPSAAGSAGASTFVAGRGLIGSVKSSAPVTASLECWHDSYIEQPPYVDPGAVLWAHKSKNLNGTTS